MKCVLVRTSNDVMSIEGYDSIEDAESRLESVIMVASEAAGCQVEIHRRREEIDFDSGAEEVPVLSFFWSNGTAAIVPVKTEETSDD